MNKKIISLIMTFVFSITVSSTLVTANALVEHQDNINIIILFNENNINNDVEKLIIKSGGNIVKRISTLGGLEVECNPEIIPEIKSQNSVKSVSPNHIIKIEKNNTIDSNEYYKNAEETSYYDDKGNSYYESNSNGYYDDKGNSYYEDNNDGYYEDNNSFNDDINDIFDGNLYEKYQWDIKRVTNNGESFNIESGNHNTVVGIIDSGVDTDHPDLKDNFLGGKNLVPQDFQYDDTEIGDINDIEDRFGHGTEVAGQIAANGRIKGVAPNIGFKSYRVFNEYGQTNASICADAIIQAVNDNVNVINLSFGAYYIDGECIWIDKETGEKFNLSDDMADYSLLKRAIEYAINNDVIVVTAAGNEGLDCSDNEKLTEHFNELYENQGFYYRGLIYEEPGDFEGVINVSATDREDRVPTYSNYGDGFIDVAAPGGKCNDDFNIYDMCLTTSNDNDYEFTSGTSLAAPKVAGLASLILCKNNEFTYDEVINKLVLCQYFRHKKSNIFLECKSSTEAK